MPCPRLSGERKRTERDIYSPNTGKKYVNSPEYMKPRIEGVQFNRRNAKNNLPNLGLKAMKSGDGQWTEEADEILIRGAVTTDCNWKKVQALLPHKTMDQCQLRWQQIGAKRIGEHWINSEDRALTDIVVNNEGISWAQVTDELLKRTGSLRLVRQCRDRWSLVLAPLHEQKKKQQEAQNNCNSEDEDDCSSSDESEDDDDDVSPAHIQLSSPRWEDLPSIGSAGHNHGLCKRCCFFPKGRCMNGYACNFCHYPHEKRIRKNKHKNRRERERARKDRRLNEQQVGEQQWNGAPVQLPVFDGQVFVQMPGEVVTSHPSVMGVAPTCLPCIPANHEASPSPLCMNFAEMGQAREQYQQQQYMTMAMGFDMSSQNGCGCHADTMPSTMMRMGSGQSLPESNHDQSSEATAVEQRVWWMPKSLGSSEETLPVGSCQISESWSRPPLAEEAHWTDASLSVDDSVDVAVWVEGFNKQYQFSREDLMGFFGCYGEVTSVSLTPGGGSSVAFVSSEAGRRAASDLDGIHLPALNGILRVRIVQRSASQSTVQSIAEETEENLAEAEADATSLASPQQTLEVAA